MPSPKLKQLAIKLGLMATGMANTLTFAPFDHFFISWLTLTALLFAIYKVKNQPKKTFEYGLFYGLGWFGAGISWVHVSIDTFGGLPLIGSIGLMTLLVGYLALYPALACYLTARFSPKVIIWPLSFAAFWFLSEWLRSFMLTGFPWLSLGYGQLTSPLATLAPVIGEIGITFVLCVIAAALMVIGISLAPNRFNLSPSDEDNNAKNNKVHLVFASGLIAIVILVTFLTPAQWTKPLNSSKQLLLVQGNIEQSIRWQPENDWPNMLKHLDLTRPHYDQVDLIIWPEAAIPILEPLAQEELHNLNKVAAQNHTAVITGIIDYHTDTKTVYNTLITLGLRNNDDTKGRYYYMHQNRYTKHQLLPIGEFVPFEDFLRPLAPIFDLPMSSFTRGDKIQPNLRANGINLAPAICYEIIFPQLLRQNIKDETDIILTVSNDAWFGDSIGPHQHMQIAQMRALEFGRPVVRATNNGVTAVTDHQGNITAQLPQFTADVLKADVGLVTGKTPYLIYGDMPMWVVNLLILLVTLVWWKVKGEK